MQVELIGKKIPAQFSLREYIYALPADCSIADLTVLKNMTTNLTLESHNMLNSFAKERAVKSLWISNTTESGVTR